MKLYWWWSDALKQYAPGRLIAVARDADEARGKIRAHFEAWAAENRAWWFLTDERDEYDEATALLEADLGKKPEEAEALYVMGSE